MKNRMNPLRNNLKNNFWNIVNRQSIKDFDFNGFLRKTLADSRKRINPNDKYIIQNFAGKMREKYTETLKEINMNAGLGDILKAEKEMTGMVVDEISRDVENFLSEMDER